MYHLAHWSCDRSHDQSCDDHSLWNQLGCCTMISKNALLLWIETWLNSLEIYVLYSWLSYFCSVAVLWYTCYSPLCRSLPDDLAWRRTVVIITFIPYTMFDQIIWFHAIQHSIVTCDVTLCTVAEVCQRLDAATLSICGNMLTYLLPWLLNIELVNPQIPTGSFLPPLPKINDTLSMEKPSSNQQSKSPLKGQGWGSQRATEMVLTNLMYLTVKVTQYCIQCYSSNDLDYISQSENTIAIRLEMTCLKP